MGETTFKDFVPLHERPKFQLLAKQTQPRSYDKGCLWPNCNGSSIQAHVVARAWMRQIATSDKVVNIFPPTLNYLSGEERFADTPRGRRPIRFELSPRHLNLVQSYHFLCKPHDDSFSTVDGLTQTYDYTTKNLNWAVYRSILAQEWRVESRKSALTEFGLFDSTQHRGSGTAEHRASVRAKLDESLSGLGYYKQNLQDCLEPQNCSRCNGTQCSFVTHTVLHLRGKPKLAASMFSLGRRSVENYGLSVIPRTDGRGQDVIWHHFGEHQKVMEKRMACQRRAQGRKREELVSQCILRLADALVVSPEWWTNIGSKRRDAILDMISAETGIATGPPEWVSLWLNRASMPILDLPNPRQLNLFRDD